MRFEALKQASHAITLERAVQCLAQAQRWDLTSRCPDCMQARVGAAQLRNTLNYFIRTSHRILKMFIHISLLTRVLAMLASA
jgi:hypothetical protein